MYNGGYWVQQTYANTYKIYNHQRHTEYHERSTQYSVITYMGKESEK